MLDKMSLLVDDDDGFILSIVLVLVSILVIIAASFVSIVTFDLRSTGEQLRRTKTFYIAESGIAKAWDDLNNNNRVDIIDNVLANDGILSFGSSVNFGDGNYSVRVVDNEDGDGDNSDDSDGIAQIISNGTLGNRNRIIHVLFSNIFYTDKTILTGGDLEIGDNDSNTTDETTVRNIVGINNCNIHTNGDLIANEASETKIDGEITVSGNVTIADEDVQLLDKDGNTPTGGDDYVPIPPVEPEFYKPLADHILSGNQVFDQTSDVVNWDTYYVDGDVTLTGELGSNTVLHITVIATGNIEVSGEVKIHASEPNMLLIAGENITIKNEPKFYDGAILAHKKIDIIGGTTTANEIMLRNGIMIAENADGSSNHINGELTITREGNADQVKFSNKDIKCLSWHL